MRRAALLVVIACTATVSLVLLAGPASAAGRPSAKAPPCTAKTANSATKAIKKTWDVILNGTGPATLDQKAAAIQGTNDPAFRQVFNQIAQQNATLLKTTTVRVDTVKCTAKTAANVGYTLILAGKVTPGLAPPGNAVLDAGAWKATKSTICDLFALENPALTQSGPCSTP
jgi:hypothetical protein